MTRIAFEYALFLDAWFVNPCPLLPGLHLLCFDECARLVWLFTKLQNLTFAPWASLVLVVSQSDGRIVACMRNHAVLQAGMSLIAQLKPFRALAR